MVFGTSNPPAGAAAGVAPKQTTAGPPKETSTAEFPKDVLDASRDKVIIVEFYSGANAQDATFSAGLAVAVSEQGAGISLVRLNIDKHPAIAGQLRLQAVPTIYAFKDGRPVDGFAGAQPVHVVEAFLAGLAGDVQAADLAAVLKAADEALETGDLQGAAEVYASILQADTHNAAALAGLAQCYLKSGDVDRARQTIGLVAPDQQSLAQVQSVMAALDLAEIADETGDISALKEAAEANPDDLQARFDYAVGLGATGHKLDAVDMLLEIVRQDREWNEEAARKQLVQFFEAWGFKDPATIEGRRRLSSVLFS